MVTFFTVHLLLCSARATTVVTDRLFKSPPHDEVKACDYDVGTSLGGMLAISRALM